MCWLPSGGLFRDLYPLPTSCKPTFFILWPSCQCPQRHNGPTPRPGLFGRCDPALTQQHPQGGGPGAQGMLLHLDAVQHLGAVRLPAREAPLQRLGTCCYIHGTQGALRTLLAGRLALAPVRPLRCSRGGAAPAGSGPPAAPRQAWSGGALAPGPGVVQAGPGGRQPRAPCSPGHSQPRAPAARLSPACQSRVPAAAAGSTRSSREEEAAAAAAGGGGGGGAGAAPRAGGARVAQRGPGRGAAGRGAPGALPALLQCHGAPEERLGLELGLAAEGYSGREPPHPSSNFLTFELIGAPRITAPR